MQPIKKTLLTAFRRNPVLVFLLIAAAVWLVYKSFQPSLYDPNATPRPVTARGSLANDEQNTIELFRSASPSVVYITTLAVKRNIFSLNAYEIPQGTGSGFIWDNKGRIVTPPLIQGIQVARFSTARDGSSG